MQTKILSRFTITVFILCNVLLSNTVKAQKPATGLYKDWNYTPSEVIGLIPLTAVNNRTYYKISLIDRQYTEIRKYNPAGNLVTTTVIEFYNGKLLKQTTINEWNDTTEVNLFTYDGGNNFIVTKQKSGRNELSPAKYVRYVFGTEGTLQQIQYLSDSNKLINNANGVAVIVYKRYTDENRFGEIKEAAYLDADYKAVVSKSLDYHRVIYERDSNDNQLSRKYLDTADMPVRTRNMIAEVRSEYDAYGQLTKETRYDSAGNPTVDIYKVAGNKYEYENGFIVKESHFDLYGNLAKASEEGDGIAIIKFQNDIRGNHIEKTYYDQFGRMINAKDGYHKVTYQYNDQDMLTGYRFFNAFQSPVADASGVHRYGYTRDNKGRMLELKYYNTNDQPCTDKLDRVFMVKYKYDSLSRIISLSYWYNDFVKMKRWNGYHSVDYIFNVDGKPVEYRYKDEKGNYIKASNDYSRKLIDYDLNGRMSKISLYNEDTATTTTIATIKDYHAVQFFYSKSNLVDSLAYFDTNNQPVNASIELDNNLKILAYKVQFIYKGNTIVGQAFYLVNSNTPSITIDCLKSNYVLANGVGTKLKTNKE